MTIAVDWYVKHQFKQTNKKILDKGHTQVEVGSVHSVKERKVRTRITKYLYLHATELIGRIFFMVFTTYGHGGHLGHVTLTIYI